jgi:hypothetical protein
MKQHVGVGWFHLAQEWILWPAVVNTVMNLSRTIKVGGFLD